MRFELTTPTLARLCSTPELRPLAPHMDGVGSQCLNWRAIASAICAIVTLSPRFWLRLVNDVVTTHRLTGDNA